MLGWLAADQPKSWRMAAKITVRLAQGAALIDCMRRCHRTRIPNALHRPLFSTRTSDRCVIARAAAEASGEIKPYQPTTIGGCYLGQGREQCGVDGTRIATCVSLGSLTPQGTDSQRARVASGRD